MCVCGCIVCVKDRTLTLLRSHPTPFTYSNSHATHTTHSLPLPLFLLKNRPLLSMSKEFGTHTNPHTHIHNTSHFGGKVAKWKFLPYVFLYCPDFFWLYTPPNLPTPTSVKGWTWHVVFGGNSVAVPFWASLCLPHTVCMRSHTHVHTNTGTYVHAPCNL